MKITEAFAGSRTFTFVNQCKQTIWVGALGNVIPNNGGWKLDPGQSNSVSIPGQWSGRFWGRTGCDFTGTRHGCATGDCGGREACAGIGGSTPATLAEFTLDGAGGKDFYDVSLVDGYNLPMEIKPQAGTFLLTVPRSHYDCGVPTCTSDLNATCPTELQLKNRLGSVVGCLSACERFGTDAYCCRGAFGQPTTCPPTDYSKIFKSACPQSYSYAYDDASSTFTCAGTDYAITFCPAGEETPPQVVPDRVIPEPSPFPSLVPFPAPSLVPSPVQSPLPSPVASSSPSAGPLVEPSELSDFTYFVKMTSDHQLKITFLPKKPAEFVDVHYRLPGSILHNFMMTRESDRAWVFTTPETLSLNGSAELFFTYKLSGFGAHDSKLFLLSHVIRN